MAEDDIVEQVTPATPVDPAGGASNHQRHATDRDRPQGPQWISIAPRSVKRVAITAMVAVFATLAILAAFAALRSFLFLILLAWLVSIAMEPAVGWLSGHRVRRSIASALVLLGGFLVTAGLVALFGQVFISQAAELGGQFPATMKQAIDGLNSTFHTDFDASNIQASLQVTPAQLSDLAGRYGGGLLGVFGSVVGFVFDALTILVFAYYLSADSPRLRQTIGSWIPARYQRIVVTVWAIAVDKTGGYVVSKVLLAAVSSFFHVIFFFWIDVPFWLPLGLLAGIVGQFVPAIGTYLGVLLPALFTMFDKPIKAIWIILFATVYQLLENYVFTPRISRRTMDVHPAVALAAVFAGAALFGAVGAVIGIPVAAALLTIFDTYRRRHELLPELADLDESDDQSAPSSGLDPPVRREDPTDAEPADH